MGYLKEILEEMVRKDISNLRESKNIELGDFIRPIDEYISNNVYTDKNLYKKLKTRNNKFTKEDEFNVIQKTEHDIVAVVNGLYVIIPEEDFSEFEVE